MKEIKLDKCAIKSEVGCQLDHCPRGHHLTEIEEGDFNGRRIGSYYLHDDGLRHEECWEEPDEDCDLQDEIREAELAAGWDRSP